MNDQSDTLSEAAALEKIIAELVAKGLVDASLQADLTRKIDARGMNAQEWRLLAEKSLMQEARRGDGD